MAGVCGDFAGGVGSIDSRAFFYEGSAANEA